MTVAVIMDFAGGEAAAYDRVLDRMGLTDRAPEGCVFHAAGPTDGGWRVVDVWDDAAKFGEFAETSIRPHAGAEGLPEPAVQIIEVEEMYDERDGAGDVSLLQVVRLGIDGDTFRDADSDIRDNKEPPPGCLFHVNGPSGDGGWIVVDAWTDKDTRDQFIGSKVVPAMQSRNIGPPTIEDLPLHNTLAAH